MVQEIKNKVVVFGGSHHNTLGVIRSLGEKGIESYLILYGEKESFVTKSCYLKQYWLVDNEEMGLAIMLTHFKNEQVKPIVICTSDSTASIIDLHFDILKKSFYIPNAGEQGKITRLMNKEVMSQLAEECNFLVPKTWLFNMGSTLPKDIIYPCITKPLLSINGSKSDICICKNKEELEIALKMIKSNQIQIQEFINKDFEFQLIGCSINEGEKIIIPGISKIIRPSKTSNTGYLTYIPFTTFPMNLEKSIDFIKRTGYSGLFSMEFLRDIKNDTYFMEINFRNDGNAYSVTAAGVNLPWLMCHFLINDNINDTDFYVKKQIYVMPEIADIHQILQKKVSLYVWLKDLFKTNSFLLFNKRDLKPFFYEITKTVTKSISKRIR